MPQYTFNEAANDLLIVPPSKSLGPGVWLLCTSDTMDPPSWNSSSPGFLVFLPFLPLS